MEGREVFYFNINYEVYIAARRNKHECQGLESESLPEIISEFNFIVRIAERLDERMNARMCGKIRRDKWIYLE